MPRILLLALIGFCSWNGAFSFHAVAARTKTPSPTTLGKRFATTTSIDNASSSASVTALERLLAIQKSEVQETERLLKRLNFNSTSDAGNHTEGDISRSLSTAASIMSGFDYGFKSRSEGAKFADLKGASSAFEGYGPPANIVSLGVQQFIRNLNAIKGEYRDEEDVTLSPKQKELQEKLESLTLNSTAIWERELADGPIVAPYVIKIPYLFLCYMLDTVFEGRYVPARFFLLETVARMPYFAYITMLHLYETLGFWRSGAEMKRVHFSQEINEFRHLLIMESLGGDQVWMVRFLAQHSALAYFIILCHLWALSPTLSYRFSELLETHAVNTYGEFLDENELLLKTLPPSLSAVEYYSFGSSDPFYTEFQTTALANGAEFRRPGEDMFSLHDVFSAIRDDEGDHVSTMNACLDPTASMQSPSMEKRILTGIALVSVAGSVLTLGDFSDFSSLSDLIDSADGDALIEGGSAATDIVDFVIAGVVGFVQQVTADEETAKVADVGADLLEVGAAGAVTNAARQSLVSFLTAIAEFVAAVL